MLDDEKDDFEFEEDTFKRGLQTDDLKKKTQQPSSQPPKKGDKNAED